MSATLRRLHPYGEAIGAGAVVHDRHQNGWIVDNWSPSAPVVYCRKPGREQDTPTAFGPAEIGCYIGEPAGQPISDIKWGSSAKTGRVVDGKPPKLWFVAFYGEGGLDVQFYDEPLAYGRAVLEAQRNHEAQSGMDFGETSYTYGEAKA